MVPPPVAPQSVPVNLLFCMYSSLLPRPHEHEEGIIIEIPVRVFWPSIWSDDTSITVIIGLGITALLSSNCSYQDKVQNAILSRLWPEENVSYNTSSSIEIGNTIINMIQNLGNNKTLPLLPLTQLSTYKELPNLNN